jgi:hypothetical protein
LAHNWNMSEDLRRFNHDAVAVIFFLAFNFVKETYFVQKVSEDISCVSKLYNPSFPRIPPPSKCVPQNLFCHP